MLGVNINNKNVITSRVLSAIKGEACGVLRRRRRDENREKRSASDLFN